MSSTKSTFVPDFNLKTPVTTKGNRHPLDNTKEISMKQWLYSRLIELGVINLDPCCTGYIAPPSWGVTTGITALAGGGQTGATALTSYYNRVDTVATAGDSVILPAAAVGKIVVVKNNTTTDLAVFPYTSDTINGGSANASITIPGGDTKVFESVSTVNWETDQAVTSGGNGTAANPTFTFNSDSDTGVYRSAANTLAFTAGGTKRVDISTTYLTSTLPIKEVSGTNNTPSYTFTSDTTTGMYLQSNGVVGLTAGGNLYLYAGSGGINTSYPIFSPNGTVSSPSYCFSNGANQGFYSISTTQIGVSIAGVLQGGWSSSTGGLFTGSISEQTTGSGVTIKQAVINKYTTFAVNTSATVSAANFNKGYFTSLNSGAVTLTLDTATNIGTQLGAVQGTTFDFYVDNNSSSTSTVTVALGSGITAATPVITGGATLTVSTANGIGWFRLVFSSSTAAKLFRVG